jgi:hypothetical protein
MLRMRQLDPAGGRVERFGRELAMIKAQQNIKYAVPSIRIAVMRSRESE